MEALLLALGLSSSIVSWIMGLPFFAIFGIVAGLILVKFVLVPATSKAITEIFNKYFSTGDKLLTKLDEISAKLDNNNSRNDRLEALIQDLVSDTVGNTDHSLAISTFALIMDKMHMRTIAHFNYRCRVNHFIGNESIIQTRYTNISSELASKSDAQLGKYFYNGLPLNAFFKNGGLDSYCRHLNVELYNLQGLRASGDLQANQINETDVEAGIDRLLETQIILFKNWLNNQRDESIYMNIKNQYPVKIIDNRLISD